MEKDFVTFEQAKLLKEKNFNQRVDYSYTYSLTSQENEEDGFSGPFGWEKGELILNQQYFENNNDICDYSNESWYMCAAPQYHEVVEWLRVNHGIWIYIVCELGNHGENYYPKLSICSSEKWLDMDIREKVNDSLRILFDFKTPQEAYSAAIDYVLNKVI